LEYRKNEKIKQRTFGANRLTEFVESMMNNCGWYRKLAINVQSYTDAEESKQTVDNPYTFSEGPHRVEQLIGRLMSILQIFGHRTGELQC